MTSPIHLSIMSSLVLCECPSVRIHRGKSFTSVCVWVWGQGTFKMGVMQVGGLYFERQSLMGSYDSNTGGEKNNEFPKILCTLVTRMEY